MPLRKHVWCSKVSIKFDIPEYNTWFPKYLHVSNAAMQRVWAGTLWFTEHNKHPKLKYYISLWTSKDNTNIHDFFPFSFLANSFTHADKQLFEMVMICIEGFVILSKIKFCSQMAISDSVSGCLPWVWQRVACTCPLLYIYIFYIIYYIIFWGSC